ncbi:MAG: PIN domain-containing protein [Victivallales bacterium]
MKVFIDSDVIIWFLRGDMKANDFFKAICASKQHELWTGALQRIEIVFYMRKSEEKETMKFLSLFKTHPLDEKLIDSAGEIYRKWNPSHGTDIPDAVLAAAALHSGGKILTLNTRHYPIPDLAVEKAWKAD